MQKMMGILQTSVYALLGVLTIVLLVQAQDQSGFISIDCGLPANSSYSEETTGINYISDAKYISTGESKTVPTEFRATKQQQLWYLRRFPSGTRNCYKIKVTSGTKYLIRASFFYGNYDDQNELPEFALHLGANVWETVKFTNASISINYEIIHIPPLDNVQICLVNTGSGIPFISAIELRTLKNTTYITQSGSLSRFLRVDMGNSNLTYRFKNDIYDRFWLPILFNGWMDLSMTLSPNSLSQNDYQPPAIVMSTAATPVNISGSFDFYWDPDNVNDQFYIYMHFTEVQVIPDNETRAFNISLNGDYWYGPLSPLYQVTTTIFSSKPLTGSTRYLFSLYQSWNSTLPPTINAVEVYQVKDFSQSDTDQDDVDAITNIKSTYGLTRNWQGDPCAPVAYMWQGLNCSVSGTDPSRIISLNLSSSGLTGEIPLDISKLTMLQSLDLSNNSLSGSIPDFLTKLPSMTVLNLAKNNLSGSIPSELLDKSRAGSLSLSVEQNPILCGTTSCNQNGNQTEKKKKNNIVIPIVAAIGGALVLLLIIGVVVCIFCGIGKRKPPAAGKVDMEPSTPTASSFEIKNQQYSYTDLVKMTNNFDRVLGKGGFGTVYHGFIDDIQVAVKILSASSVQGYQQFVAEVKLLMRVHHRNLTSLIGYCNEENNIGLIYEYMANGNLDELLSGRNSGTKFLTWEDRLRIAMDSAQGLEYLHNGCKPPIIHRDVKTTNILLTETLHAKLADFGLSKSFPTDGGTHVSTVVAGTPGYLDPEYYISNRLTEKSDIYSFGVVLLEIITGQPAITRTHEKTHISQFVGSMLDKGDIKNVVDPKLNGEFDTSSVWKAVEIAMACLSHANAKRPNMSDVVAEIKDCLAAELARKRSHLENENKDSIELVSLNLTTELNPVAR
ncbi:hypothetical protein L6164_004318 [Bauhinia variegata]|uniref:Uncharacterized protein n=1 Tax=Bauhinia variegata TaxID=167791 RepID=A0ACB9Q426_BAUVA|nr:hypothetical protein L6164_004318 [Bauhinia variegata]